VFERRSGEKKSNETTAQTVTAKAPSGAKKKLTTQITKRDILLHDLLADLA
jgi:hypothetical protein